MCKGGTYNSFFKEKKVSPKLVILGFYITNYRRTHNISQRQMADICTLYGKPHNIKFSQVDIWNYERYRCAPTPPKFQVLMNALNIDESMF